MFNNITDLRTPNSGRMTAHDAIMQTIERIPTSPCTFATIVTEEPICDYYYDGRASAPSDYRREWWEYAHEYD